MNIIWTFLMLSSLAVLIVKNPQLALSSMLTGSENAVSLALKLVASYAFWLGLFSLLEKLKITDGLARLLRAPVNFLFPNENAQAKKFITLNISANLLGLGNASTPMGINAINSMYKDRITDNISTFIVISATSLQILPTTLISLRISAGSSAPMSIFFPSLVATISSTFLGIVICKIIAFCRNKNKKRTTLCNTYARKMENKL